MRSPHHQILAIQYIHVICTSKLTRAFPHTHTGTDTTPGHRDVLVVTLELVLNKYTVYVVKLDKTVGMSSKVPKVS